MAQPCLLAYSSKWQQKKMLVHAVGAGLVRGPFGQSGLTCCSLVCLIWGMHILEGRVHEPVAIANFFVRQHCKKGLTLMQVLKLSYIAHGFKLGLGYGPMANEYVEAWQHGPVFPSIYHEFKYQIKVRELGTEVNQYTPVESNFSDKDKKTLELVDYVYGSLDGWRLSKLTHEKNTPWDKTYNSHEAAPHIRGLTIKNELIEAHFKKIVDEHGIKI